MPSKFPKHFNGRILCSVTGSNDERFCLIFRSFKSKIYFDSIISIRFYTETRRSTER
jgi:hypothetical protein